MTNHFLHPALFCAATISIFLQLYFKSAVYISFPTSLFRAFFGCPLPMWQLSHNRLAKPNPNQFRIFRFRAIDLLNLKTVSWNRPNRFTDGLLQFTPAMHDGIVNKNESLTYFAW